MSFGLKYKFKHVIIERGATKIENIVKINNTHSVPAIFSLASSGRRLNLNKRIVFRIINK